MNRYTEIQQYLFENQRTWLVTGVAGFIGSNLLEKLLMLNQKVIGVDNFITGFKSNIKEAIKDAENELGRSLNKNFSFIDGDITDLETCDKACDGVDYILHQAALGSVPRSINDPISSSHVNVRGFLNIIEASKKAEVKRLVYASSSSVYGDNPNLPKIEDSIGNPLSPYALTKLINELYAKVYLNNYNFESIGLRYFNIFGKRQDPMGSYAAVIPKWAYKIIKNQKVFINGDGKTSRDFCYVENAVQMNILAATSNNKEAVNQVYNVALNDRTSLYELYNMIEERLINKDLGLTKKPPIYRDFREGDVRHSEANISKSKELLGYSPKYNISKGLDAYLDWFVKDIT